MKDAELSYVTDDMVLNPYRDICPFCLDELRRGIPADGKCGHEETLAKYPHLRFNARDHLSQTEWVDSVARYELDHTKNPE